MQLKVLQAKTHSYLTASPSDFNHDAIGEYMKELSGIIKEHNSLYYLNAKPIISDSQYDQLFDLLKQLESKYPAYIAPESPTQRLVGQLSGFQKSSHRVPLLSLMNTYSTEDIENWGKTLFNTIEKRGDSQQNIRYCIESKLDGNAVEVIYKNGIFHSALTRGDGLIGENITEHAKYLIGLPIELTGIFPSELSLRGEIIMSKQAHTRLNDIQIQEGLPLFANPRNAVAGTLRSLEPSLVQYRGLTVLFYDILYMEGCACENQYEMYQYFAQRSLPFAQPLNFPTTLEEVKTICNNKETEKTMQSAWYETDGLVIKVDDYLIRKQVGSTHHHPKWAMAYKFPSKQVSTKLLSVSYQIGRTGVVTPVAELEPVVLGGVTVSRASLHNFEQIEKLDIHVGDYVWVQRSGEVIPYVVGPVLELRDGTEQAIEVPMACPVCHHGLVKEDNYVALYCNNSFCSARVTGAIIHVASKDCLDIKGLGESIIALLVEVGLLKSMIDLFHLSDPQQAMQLRMLPGLADKKIKQILESIESTKTLPLWRWFHALGIDGVGVKTAQELEQRCARKRIVGAASIRDAFANFQEKDIHGFGGSLQDALHKFASERGTFLLELEAIGVNCTPYLIEEHTGILSGKNIVITGVFDLPRSELITMIESYGGKVIDGVTKKTSALLVGKDPGSKLQQAEKLGIPLYYEFQEIVNDKGFII